MKSQKNHYWAVVSKKLYIILSMTLATLNETNGAKECDGN